MLKHYFTVSTRHLLRHKPYAALNILNLAVGMACVVLIGLYIQDERAYDRYHANADRIYRVVNGTNAKTSSALGPALQRLLPEVQSSVRLSPPFGGWIIRYEDRSYFEDRVFWADPGLFDVFSFPLVRGNPDEALQDPMTVVISESMARKYFGSADPLGKTVTLDTWSFTVTGVTRDMPEHSHFQADFFLGIKGSLGFYGEDSLEQWDWPAFYTYLLLSPDVDPVAFQQKVTDVLKDRFGERWEAENITMVPRVQPLTDIYLHSHLENEAGENGNGMYLLLLAALAVVVILLACFNFMNMATARSLTRIREVALRKAFGANRGQLVRQYMGESFGITCVAIVSALVLVALSLSLFQDLTGKTIALDIFRSWQFWIGIAAITLLVGFISGSYPAFFMAAFTPAQHLKGKAAISVTRHLVRRLLVMGQCMMVILLLGSTWVFTAQLDYIQGKRLGLRPERVLVGASSFPTFVDQYPVFKESLEQFPEIEHIGTTLMLPGRTGRKGLLPTTGTRRADLPQADIQTMLDWAITDDFIGVFGMELLAGRIPSRSRRTDWDEAVMINETAMRQLGWGSPDEAVDQAIMIHIGHPWAHDRRVIGVIADFHMRSLHHRIEPMIIRHWPRDNLPFYAIRFNTDDVTGTISRIEETWKQLMPDVPMVYSFLDEDYDRLYAAEATLREVFGVFSSVAVFMACAGLFGLASFMTARRTKEIGMRRILGATVVQTAGLLLREFVYLVLIATALAGPIAYLAMRQWLQLFSYRADVGPAAFIAAGAVVLVIALMTVSFRVVSVARANPADTLRYE
ncbi:MAG: ABC transporter permease [Gemmatimonadetes bacterium]|nr:ABC transporter permease [Gemmatimonadota bacterium]